MRSLFFLFRRNNTTTIIESKKGTEKNFLVSEEFDWKINDYKPNQQTSCHLCRMAIIIIAKL